MLLDILHAGVFADVKRVDAVVLAVAVAAVVDAAARDDRHVRALADEKVIIDHVLKAGLRQNHGNVHGFVLCARRNADVDAVLIGFRLDGDVLAVAAKGLLPVRADVHCALARALHIGNDLQNVLLYLVQHVPFTSRRLQPMTVSAMILG